MSPGQAASWPPVRVSGQVVTALPEVLIVSVECPLKDGSPGFFQGALLRIPAQRNSPGMDGVETGGMTALGPLTPEDFAQKLEADNPRDYLLENYPSIAHRHTYFQEANQKKGAALESGAVSKPGGSGGLGGKKLGVRLRARQVLCNKCKNVCNERGENVQHKARRQSLNSCQTKSDPPPKGSSELPGRRSSMSKTARNAGSSPGVLKKLKISQNNTLVPRLKRLNQSDIDRLSDRSSDGYDEHSGEESSTLDTSPTKKAVVLKRQEIKRQNQTQSSTNPSSVTSMAKPLKIKLSGNAHAMTGSPILNPPPVLGPTQANLKECDPTRNYPVGGRTLRRKRCAVGSMEDLWDETVFEDIQVQTKTSKKDTLKMSSVALTDQKASEMASVKDENSSVSAHASEKPPETSGQGAKLLKIFYGSRGKETVLKIPASQLQAGSTPPSQSDTEENEENAQLTAKKSKDASKKAAKKALKRARKEAQRRAQYGGASPGSYLAGRSPAYRGGRSPIPSPVRMVSPFAHPGGFSPGRYGYSPASYASYSPAHSKSPAYSVSLPQNSPENDPVGARKIKHKRKKHKKKKPDDGPLSSNVKAEGEEVGTSSSPLTSRHNIFVDDEVISSDQVRIWGSFPPFVETDAAEIGGQTVDSAEMENGTTMNVGTLIWGKIPNHPWWPGKVVNIYLRSLIPGGRIRPQALVLWLGCEGGEKTSLFPCERLRLFREGFKDCFSHSASRNLTYKSAVEMANQEDEQPSNNVFGLGSSSRISQTPNTPTHISATSPGGSFSPRTVDCLS